MKEETCLTPGCQYNIRITSYDFKRNATLKVEVRLPRPLKIPDVEDRIGGDKSRNNYLKAIEDILHKHLEAATASIGQLDRHYGGTLAKEWPLPPATLTSAWEVGYEVGRRFKATGEPQ